MPAVLERVDPLSSRTHAAGALVIDIRPLEQRQRDGELPGPWSSTATSRVAPGPDQLVPAARRHRPHRRIVIVCNEGFSSSLAAHTLQQLGLANATDLRGGFQAWAATQRLGRSETDPSGPGTRITT